MLSATDGPRTRLVWVKNNRSWSCTLWSWSCRSGVVLWNTVLSRSSSWWSWKWHSNISSTIYSFSILYLEHHYCHILWRSTVAFTFLKVKSAMCLCLLPAVLVLLLWFWSCKQRSWCCYFGLGLKNLVLFTSLENWRTDNNNNKNKKIPHVRKVDENTWPMF